MWLYNYIIYIINIYIYTYITYDSICVCFHQVSRLSKFQDCCCKYLQGIRDKQLSLSGTLIRSTQCHRASSLLFWIRMECGSQTKPIPFHLGASLHSKTGVSPKCKGCRMLQELVCYVLWKAKSSGNVLWVSYGVLTAVNHFAVRTVEVYYINAIEQAWLEPIGDKDQMHRQSELYRSNIFQSLHCLPQG